MSRNPFTRYIAQGYRVQLLHTIGKTSIAKVQELAYGNPAPFYAAKHRHHHGEGHTPAEAIQKVREARASFEASEQEQLMLWQIAAALKPEYLTVFEHFNPGLFEGITRAELRRIVTHPDRKLHNWTHYRDQLRALGIALSKPKKPSN